MFLFLYYKREQRTELIIRKILTGQIAATLEIIFEGFTCGEIKVVIVLLSD